MRNDLRKNKAIASPIQAGEVASRGKRFEWIVNLVAKVAGGLYALIRLIQMVLKGA